MNNPSEARAIRPLRARTMHDLIEMDNPFATKEGSRRGRSQRRTVEGVEMRIVGDSQKLGLTRGATCVRVCSVIRLNNTFLTAAWLTSGTMPDASPSTRPRAAFPVSNSRVPAFTGISRALEPQRVAVEVHGAVEVLRRERHEIDALHKLRCPSHHRSLDLQGWKAPQTSGRDQNRDFPSAKRSSPSSGTGSQGTAYAT